VVVIEHAVETAESDGNEEVRAREPGKRLVKGLIRERIKVKVPRPASPSLTIAQEQTSRVRGLIARSLD